MAIMQSWKLRKAKMIEYSKLKELIEIHSPSGYTHEASEYINKLLNSLGCETRYTNKGAVACSLGKQPRLAICAHVDTLGGVVCDIKDGGMLKISAVGGLTGSLFEGEYVEIITLAGERYKGTFLLDNPSVHANAQATKKERQFSNMHIRLDEEALTKSDIAKLGIRVGDFVCFDTRYQELGSGYIKSRFLDNKSGCFVLFELARRAQELDKDFPVELYFSNYEEVGHGGTCGYSSSVEELLVIDMGVVGEGCQGRETLCSICAKDSTGPYDFHMRKRLVELAEEKSIPFCTDVYPFYGSDGSAALSAGHDVRVALVGPGVSASHGVERTHKKGIEATIELCWAYMNTLVE
jgi:putative aminopeptidase FrvX